MASAIPIPCAVVVVVMLVFMAGSALRATSQFDQAHDSLVQANGRIAAAEAQLTMVQDNLRFLRVQITASQTALSADTSVAGGCSGRPGAGPIGRRHEIRLYRQPEDVPGGIQQALNALSVGDENHAVAALNAVSSACQSVAASSG